MPRDQVTLSPAGAVVLDPARDMSIFKPGEYAISRQISAENRLYGAKDHSARLSVSLRGNEPRDENELKFGQRVSVKIGDEFFCSLLATTFVEEEINGCFNSVDSFVKAFNALAAEKAKAIIDLSGRVRITAYGKSICFEDDPALGGVPGIIERLGFMNVREAFCGASPDTKYIQYITSGYLPAGKVPTDSNLKRMVTISAPEHNLMIGDHVLLSGVSIVGDALGGDGIYRVSHVTPDSFVVATKSYLGRLRDLVGVNLLPKLQFGIFPTATWKKVERGNVLTVQGINIEFGALYNYRRTAKMSIRAEGLVDTFFVGDMVEVKNSRFLNLGCYRIVSVEGYTISFRVSPSDIKNGNVVSDLRVDDPNSILTKVKVAAEGI